MRDEVFGLESAFGFVPLIHPVDHSDEREGGCSRTHHSFGFLRLLRGGDALLDKLDVLLLARVDALAKSARKRMVLVEHDRDFAIARADDNFDVEADQRAQALLGVFDLAHGGDYAVARDVHGVAEDVKEDVIFALEVMVEPALAELEGCGDIVHGGGVVSTLFEEAGGGVQDFLPGIVQVRAGHAGVHGTEGRTRMPTLPLRRMG